MNNSNTSSLFHYTQKVGDLKLILENGLKPNYCKEQFLNNIVIGIPMVSFCDIPIGRTKKLREGIRKSKRKGYGNYSIGLTKEWGLSKNVSPLFYQHSSDIKHFLSNHYSTVIGLNNRADEDIENIALIHPKIKSENGEICSYADVPGSDIAIFNKMNAEFIKADMYSLYGLVKKYQDNDGYVNYNENEWRYVARPYKCEWLWGEEKCIEWRGEGRKRYPETDALTFNVDDVNFIILKNKTDIPNFVNHINKLKTLGGNEITEDGKKILLTKIVTLEDIENNF